MTQDRILGRWRRPTLRRQREPPGALLAVAGFKLAGHPKIRKRAEAAPPYEENAATVTAVATVRATARNVFFTPETDATGPAVTGNDK